MNEEEIWEKEQQRLIKLIKVKKIEYDKRLIICTIEDVCFPTRIDLIPMSARVSEHELKEIWTLGKGFSMFLLNYES